MPEASSHNRPQPVVRGGFVVHRRTSVAGTISTPPHRLMHEHGSLEAAQAEAARLAAKFGHEFAVFQEVGSALPAADAGEAV